MHRNVPALIAALVALGAGLALAEPARPLAEREARLAARIDASVHKRLIDEAQGLRLRDRLRRIRKLEAYYHRSHGLSAWERRDLERRLNALGARLTADERAARRG